MSLSLPNAQQVRKGTGSIMKFLLVSSEDCLYLSKGGPILLLVVWLYLEYPKDNSKIAHSKQPGLPLT